MKRSLILFAALAALGTPAARGDDAHGHPAADRRVVLQLTPAERAMVLEEMRLFLGGVQKLTAALGRQDMPGAAAAARAMGQRLAHEVPPATRVKLPLEFRQLGAAVHGEFDQIALDAESLQDVSYSLGQLASTLQKCVACHATYQIRTHAVGDAR